MTEAIPFLGTRARDINKMSFGNALILEVDKMDDPDKPDKIAKHFLQSNFEISREGCEFEEFKAVIEPEFVLGPIYEKDGERLRNYGWFVEVEPTTEKAKAKVSELANDCKGWEESDLEHAAHRDKERNANTAR